MGMECSMLAWESIEVHRVAKEKCEGMRPLGRPTHR